MAKVNPIQLQKYLKGVDYPASKQDLIEHAEEAGADENIISTLEQLPEDEDFETPTDVNQAIGEID
jgi:trehalose-6-phosphatase